MLLRRSSNKTTWILALLLALIVCSLGIAAAMADTDTTSPSVSWSIPYNGQTNVALNNDPTVVVQFSEPISDDSDLSLVTFKNPTTVEATIELQHGADFSQLVITALAELNENTTYTVTIPAASILDMAGNPLASPVVIVFTTKEIVTPAVTLSVNPASVDLVTGGTQQLTPTVNPADATVGYTSSNPAVATVSATGLVTAIAPGNANITVTATKTGYTAATPVVVPVTVTAPPAVALFVTPASASLLTGELQPLAAIVFPADATVGFVSDNTAVATVDAAGLVTAVAPGSANITVTATKAGYTDATPVIVPVTVTGIEQVGLSVSPVSVNLLTGETQQLAATVIPADATVGYASDNTAIATVDAAGLVTAIAPGSANITVTATRPGYTDATPVIVPVTVTAPPVVTLSVNPTSVSLITGGTQQLTPVVDPADAIVGYASDNTAVATVDAAGLVSAVAEGSANITVTATKAGYTDATPVIVPVAVSSAGEGLYVLSSTPANGAVNVTRCEENTVEIVFNKNVNEENSNLSLITFKDVYNQNVKLATDGINVNLNHVILLADGGCLAENTTYIVRIPAGSIVGDYEGEILGTDVVIVFSTGSTIAQVALSVDPAGVSLAPGATQQLDAIVFPADATAGYVSDNPSVATVDADGLVTAVALGSANITVTATRNGYLDAIPVIVPVSVEQAVALSVDPALVNLAPGGTQQLTPTVDPADATVGYASDNEAVATVDANGLVTAVALGSANITVTATRDGYLDATPVIVPVTVVPAVTLLVDPATVSLVTGGTQQLTPTVDPSDATVAFVSDNTAVADVDATGLVVAIAPGSANITVTAIKDGCIDAVPVIVPVTVTEPLVITLSVDPASLDLTTGDTRQLTPTVDPADATVGYASDDEAVATVDATGLVTAIAPGSANITVTATKPLYTDAVPVIVPVTVSSGCTATLPAVQTSAPTNIGASFATLNGTIIANGGGAITEYGFELSTDFVNWDKAVLAGNHLGAYSSNQTSLAPGTYYYKAYATNCAGTTLGNARAFVIPTTSDLALTAPIVAGQPATPVQIPITLKSLGNVSGINFDLNYDSSLLTYTTAVAGTLDPGFTFLANSPVAGKVTVVIFDMSTATMPAGEGSVALLTFQVNAGAQPGQSCPLVLTNTALSDAGANPLTGSIVNGQFYVPELQIITLSVDPAGVSLETGETQQLTPTVDPADATVAYASDNEAVATVSATGLVTAIAEGSANITVTATKDGCLDAAPVVVPVTVTDSGQDVVTLSVAPAAVSLEINETQQLTPTVNPADATVAYASDNEAVATVSATGLVTAIAEGSANITVTATKAGYTAAAPVVVPVTVTDSGQVVVTLSVAPASVSLMAGETQQLTPTVNPADATVAYASDNEAVATVSATGLVTAIANGSANITVTATKDGYLDAAPVVVKVTVSDVPAVQTDAATSISTTTATLNGEITSVGIENCDQRKFQYREEGASNWIDTTVETGTFGPGAFSFNITGLSTKTTYEFKAMAHNVAGWGEGDVMTFTTNSSGGGGGGGGGGSICTQASASTYTPAKDAANVATDAEVSVTFNVNVKKVSAESLDGITIKDGNGDTVSGVSATLSGKTLTIAHAVFANNTKFTVSIPADAVTCSDSTSESYYNDAITWSFTTVKAASTSEQKCGFPDVPETHWAFDVITILCEKGVIAGYPDGYFRPDNNITRAEFAKVITGAMGLDEVKPASPTYSDVLPGSWYYGYVEAAAKAGLVKGFETGEFRPNDLITREQMASILVRAVGKDSLAQASAGEKTSFSDDSSISDWARGYVVAAVQEGLLGYPDNTFKAGDNATRAEACSLIVRFLED